MKLVLQQQNESSGAPLRGTVATSKFTAEISAKGRDDIIINDVLK
jgi:hypothetical protein